MKNREIKFRMWDVENKKFIPQSHFAILGNGKLIITESGYYNHFTNTNVDDCIIQQYTGLKDRNDNPVYEGDILEWKDGNFTSEVYWSDADAAFVIRTNNIGGELIHKNYILNFKVVGNIFENSDLIK